MTYNPSSPSTATPGAPTTKKTISWAKYQSRPPRVIEDSSCLQAKKDEAERNRELKRQQEELEFWQSKVDRLKREQEELIIKQERLRAEQE